MWISRIFSSTNNQRIHHPSRLLHWMNRKKRLTDSRVAGRRQSQRCERDSAECSHDEGDFLGDKDIERRIVDEIDEVGTVDANGEKGRGCKRDSSHLVGKALAKRGVVKALALGMIVTYAKDPVLTCCGHLFCWACFYQLGYIDSTSKECPVCKGVVSNGNVIPVYGNGGSEGEGETKSGLKVPPLVELRVLGCRIGASALMCSCS